VGGRWDGDGLGKVGGRVVGRVGWLGFRGPCERESERNVGMNVLDEDNGRR